MLNIPEQSHPTYPSIEIQNKMHPRRKCCLQQVWPTLHCKLHQCHDRDDGGEGELWWPRRRRWRRRMTVSRHLWEVAINRRVLVLYIRYQYNSNVISIIMRRGRRFHLTITAPCFCFCRCRHPLLTTLAPCSYLTQLQPQFELISNLRFTSGSRDLCYYFAFFKWERC